MTLMVGQLMAEWEGQLMAKYDFFRGIPYSGKIWQALN